MSKAKKPTGKERELEELKDYLFLTNLRWATIHTKIMNRFLITSDMKEEYELAVSEGLKFLASHSQERVEQIKVVKEKDLKDSDKDPLQAYELGRRDMRTLILAKLKTQEEKVG